MLFLDQTFERIVDNVALDEALLHEVEETDSPPIMRIWESPALAVVLGASGRIAEDVRRDLCDLDGVPLARRSSGGGTVVLGPGALNFTVVLPINFAPELSAVDTAQRYVLARSAEALNRLGGRESERIEVLGSGDLTVNLKKCSGSAQRRLRKNLLIHATFLYDFPLELIDRYLLLPRRQPEYRAGRPHSSFVTNFRITRASLIEGLRSAWDAETPMGPASRFSLKFMSELVETRFGRPEWIERL